MKRFGIVTVMLVAFAQSGQAETCRDKFIRLTEIGNGETPAKIHITTQMKKGGSSKNDFWFVSSDHYMTIVPGAKPQWVLTYNNTMYMSLDEGKSWKKIRTLDSKQNKDTTRKHQAENAKTVKNAVCGKEDIDGVMHETVEADITILQNINTDYHNKYWLDPKTGQAVKVVYDSKSKTYPSITTQIIERAPGLTLPMPK